MLSIGRITRCVLTYDHITTANVTKMHASSRKNEVNIKGKELCRIFA